MWPKSHIKVYSSTLLTPIGCLKPHPRLMIKTWPVKSPLVHAWTIRRMLYNVNIRPMSANRTNFHLTPSTTASVWCQVRLRWRLTTNGVMCFVSDESRFTLLYSDIKPSDYRAFGLSDLRTIGLSDYRTFGLSGPSDYRDVPIFCIWACTINYKSTFSFLF